MHKNTSKFIPLLLLFTLSLFAADKIEIYSSNMTSKGNIVQARDGVTVVYKEYFLTAKKATYNRNTGDLELFENIILNKDKKMKVLGSYAKLNIKKKEKLFQPFYMLETKSKVWMSASKGVGKNKDINITSGTTSGCDPINPLWTMDFSSSDYNNESMWLNLYNARIYIYDIPIFYTPWFGYSLDTTRRTGLLKPSFGISSTEGFFYQQPIYIAQQSWWDLELDPQIRTSRGSGLYTKFRFLDSKVSYGELKMGYFKEKEAYYKENNLLNDSHFGFNFKYDNTDVINQWFGTNLKGQSGLYVDLNHMNDVDYINLASNQSINQSTATQVLSRINMFYNTNNHYFGAYFKYYQYLKLPNNKGIAQKLPTFQYHNYLDTFFKDHLLYSLDVQSNNIQREKGKKVLQTSVNLPITLQTNMFDEFLNLSYTANVSGQLSQFTGREADPTRNTRFDNGYTIKNYHTLSASTQLTKAYKDFTHVISFGLTYTKNGFESKNGFYLDYKNFCSDPANSSAPACEFYNITDVKNTTQIDFIQYLYDSSAKQILFHRLSQNIINKNIDSKYGDLENELDYKITDAFSYYNDLFYNYDNAIFTKAINRISYNDYGVNLALSHLYKDRYIKTTDTHTYTSYLTSSVKYTYNKHYSYNFSYNYDLELREKKNLEIGFLYKKRCWEFGIRYAEDNRPILDASGNAASVYNKYIYFTITLKPFMQPSSNSSAFVYKLPGKTQ